MKTKLIWMGLGAAITTPLLLVALVASPLKVAEAACQAGNPPPCPGANGAPILLGGPGQSQGLSIGASPSAIRLSVSWLSARMADAHTSGLQTVVQWSGNNTWYDVDGWRAPLGPQGGAINWSVGAKDYGSGPFRWAIHDAATKTLIATTNPFMLPVGDQILAVGIVIDQAMGATANPASAPSDAAPAGLQVTVSTAALNVRAQPTTRSAVLGVTVRGATLQASELSADKAWYRITIGSITGWVYAALTRPVIVVVANATPAPPTDVVTPGSVPVAQALINGVVIREAANANSRVLGSVTKGQYVLVDGRSSDGHWVRLPFLGSTGWIAIDSSIALNAAAKASPILAQ